MELITFLLLLMFSFFNLDGVCVCVCVRAQSYLTLYKPMDYSTPGSAVYGTSQARLLGNVCHMC